MKVSEIMVHCLESCNLNQSLMHVCEMMKVKNFDAVPVLDSQGVLIGIVTQENVCFAIAEFDKKPSAILIAGIDFEKPVSCLDDEKIEKALKIMKKKLVKRLIITSQNGQPVGILSLEQILSLSGKKKKLQKSAFSILKSINIPQPIVLRQI